MKWAGERGYIGIFLRHTISIRSCLANKADLMFTLYVKISNLKEEERILNELLAFQQIFQREWSFEQRKKNQIHSDSSTIKK